MIKEKTKCTGCAACVELCDNHAISMIADNEGFLYPVIDSSLCTNCGKCNNSCDIVSTPLAKEGVAFRNKDNEEREKSSSGGAFSAITKIFWDKHPEGIVFGAAYNKDLIVSHIGVTKEQGINAIHGSKYVQSDLKDTYHKIKELLASNINVLFSGTPCQCAAVRKLFAYNDKLFIVDIVCNGVSSPLLFKKYIEGLSNIKGSKVLAYNFRNKKYEKGRGMLCAFKDGSILENTHGKDRFCKMYMTNMTSRPACYNCQYTTPNRNSDITIGDFHGLEEMDPNFYEDGTSLVISHTSLGDEYLDILNKVGTCKTYPIDKCLQPRLKEPAKPHMLRKLILKDYLALPIDSFDKKYGKLL